jgi:hypothetical protein
MASSNRLKGFGLGALIVLIAGTAFATLSSRDAGALEITVYRSPTCGCCSKWIAHLEANGFEVVAHDTEDMTSVKIENGIRRELSSCHTAVIDGYVIEGHVPAEDIQRLLRERPAVAGVAVPGMPIGSPGMEGPNPQAYDVLTFDAVGNTSVFASH